MSSRHIGMHSIERWMLYAFASVAFAGACIKVATADAVASRFRIPVAH